jgi:glycosyltransferase involved in cell wall biosynthesis
MKIGIDMFGTQANNRGRGVGRYTRQLVQQLLSRFTRHEYVLYYHEGIPGSDDPWQGAPVIRHVPRPRPGADPQASVEHLTRDNPDQIDVLLLSCAFDCYRDFLPPPRTARGPKVACILYDLIPALFQEQYLRGEDASRSYHWALRTARQYDLFLAISEASRADGVRVLDVPDDRVVNISAASDREFFFPDNEQPMSAASAAALAEQGIGQRFVYCVSGMDERKNLKGLLRAFQLLPAPLKQAYQLVVTCAMAESERDFWQDQATELGIGDRLILTNYVSDEVVRVLYQRCSLFVFPSLYEGFGLPILEALHCGAPVVAGRNSSQPEVLGEAGVLVDVANAADLAAGMASVLDDPQRSASLRREAPLQATNFTWESSADRAMAAIETLAPPQRMPRAAARSAPKPRIALFSPFTPLRSGVVDYAERLMESLREFYTIDLFHDAGYLPHAGLGGNDVSCHDYRLFPRFQRSLNYAGIVYQMCNSEHCGFIYETLQRFPGLVVMHDFALPEFHVWYASKRQLPVETFLANELALENEPLSREFQDSFSRWCDEPGGLCRALLTRGLTLNRRILDHAASVVVHDRWGAERMERAVPDLAERVFVVPLGADLTITSPEEKDEIKRRLGFPADALILGCFGFLNGMKYDQETIEAFAALVKGYPAARLLFVGPDFTQGRAQARAAALGVGQQVQFFGHTPKVTFLDLMAITDIGINLRRPPTRGETSSALLTLLGSGVATIITDVDAFAGYPDAVVRKVPPLSPDDRTLELALRELAGDAAARKQLGRAASDYVRQRHAWSQVARQYSDAIERTRMNYSRWAELAGSSTRAALLARATTVVAPPQALPIQSASGLSMKRWINRVGKALWRRTGGLRHQLALRLQAQVAAAIAASEARQAEAIADLNRFNDGLLREVLRLQAQVADLARAEAPPGNIILPMTDATHAEHECYRRRLA